MDKYHAKRKDVFFNNLVLLGLKPALFEEEYGIPFHKDMFDLPNKKAYTIVTYFLFSKLSAVTKKDYNLPWPCLTKEMERSFQKTCYSHLSNFSQENEVKFPSIVPSLLATVGGVRFYELYFAFSCYVLKKTINGNANINVLSRPSVTQENFPFVSEVVQLSTVRSKEKFIDIETATHVNDLIWTKFVKNLSECLQKLKQLQKANKELLRNKTARISALYCTDPNEVEKLVEECLNNINQLKKQRKILNQFFSSDEELWQHLASEIGENVDKEVLSGQDINIDIINDLPEMFNIELKKVGFSSSSKDGKTSVIRVLKLLKAYLLSLTELINSTRINDLLEIDMKDVLSTEQTLLSINSLNKRLSEKVIPDLEENLNQLKSSISLEEEENVSESPLHLIHSLPVLSYNPDQVKTRLMHMYPNLEENLRLHSSNCCSYSDQDKFSAADLSEVNTSINTTLSNTVSPDISKLKLASERKSLDQTSYFLTNTIPLDGIPSSSDLYISASDIDFAPSTHFKMRASWLEEESLSAMTLPNISFDDL